MRFQCTEERCEFQYDGFVGWDVTRRVEDQDEVEDEFIARIVRRREEDRVTQEEDRRCVGCQGWRSEREKMPAERLAWDYVAGYLGEGEEGGIEELWWCRDGG